MNNLDNFIKNCSVVCNSTNLVEITLTAEEEAKFNRTYDGKKVLKAGKTDDYRVTTAYFGFVGNGTNKDGTAIPYPGTSSGFNPINTVEQAKAAGWVYDFVNNKKVSA